MANKQYYKDRYTNQKDFKQEEQKPGYLKLFFGAFFMMLILFVIVAVHLFASVDTAIGENDEGDIKESGLGVRHLIDSRLKFIQMEDSNKRPANEAPNIIQSKEEEYSRYNNKNDASEVETKVFEGTNNAYGNNNAYSKTNTTFPDTNTSTIKHPVGVQSQQVSTARPTVYKVYIGSYSTLEQARVAQSIIQDANLGVTSFVKTQGAGAYTIQVGSYTDYNKATSLSSELKRNHFPARMVQE